MPISYFLLIKKRMLLIIPHIIRNFGGKFVPLHPEMAIAEL